MKTIKIFLASSIEDLKLDRIVLGDFIRQMNDTYLSKGLHFILIKCEDYDSSVSLEGKQAQYDEEIRSSDMAFFLFYSKVGEYTKHEFEIAFENYKTKDKPKIFTYFKYVNSVDDIDKDVKNFMGVLDEKFKHYYKTYSNIDTVKCDLAMIMAGIDNAEPDLDVKDGRVVINGTDVADSSNIPIFAGNENIQQKKQKRDKLQKEYNDLLKSGKQGDKGTVEAERKLKNAEKELNNDQKRVLKLASTVVKSSSNNKKISVRMKNAMKQLDRGNYNGAVNVLNINAIQKEAENHKRQGSKKGIRNNVKELKLLIEILNAMGVTAQRSIEIKRAYELLSILTIENDLDKTVLFEYAEFVFYRYEYAEAERLVKRFLPCFENKEELSEKDKELKAWFNHLLGRIYDAVGNRSDADSTLRKSLETRAALVEENPKDTHRRKMLADSYRDLAVAHHRSGNYAESEEEFKKAIEIQKILISEYWAYHHNLCITLAGLGNLYCTLKRYNEAEELYKSAIRSADKFSYSHDKSKNGPKKKPKKTFPTGHCDKADCYNSLGTLYFDTAHYSESEAAFREAVKIMESIVDNNFMELGGKLANNNMCLAALNEKMGHINEAIRSYVQGLAVYERLYNDDPKQFLDPLVSSYKNAYGFFYRLKDYAATEKYIKKAIDVIAKIVKDNYSVLGTTLAFLYNDLAFLYEELNRDNDALSMFKETLSLFEILKRCNPISYNKDIAVVYMHMGNLYYAKKEYIEAVHVYEHAIESNKKLINPNSHEDMEKAAILYYNLGTSYFQIKNYRKAKPVFEKALAMYEKLANKPGGNYTNEIKSVRRLILISKALKPFDF